MIPVEEAAFYETVARREIAGISGFDELLNSGPPYEFLKPKRLWLRSTYDCVSEWDAFNHIAPVRGKRVLQIGGRGAAACLFALAGAESWLLTPLEAEAEYALELARLFKVSLRCRVGVAENIPFESGCFDAAYASSCTHHFDTPVAFREIARILQFGGRFAAVEPWRAPLYSIGTKLFGKREDVNCKPLTTARIAPGHSCFSAFRVVHHGTLTRYPALAFRRLLPMSSMAVCWMTRFDDAISSVLGLRRFGSSVSLLARK